MPLSTRLLVFICVTVASAAAGAAVSPSGAAPSPPSAAAAPGSTPPVTCASCVLVDEDGTILWARAASRPRANASTTKMVTALVVVERASLAETVVVSAHAAATGGGGLDLRPGDLYSVEALLYAMLLSSSNDAAVALAEHVAGSEHAFVGAMNARARAIGATRSRFATPHGLDYPGHVSTARDLAAIADELLENPFLRRVVGTRATTISGSPGRTFLTNRNALLDTYNGAIGVKTGFTAAAGDVLVAAARRSGRRLIAVAMGSDSAAEDARRLLDLGFGRLRSSVLLRRGTAVGGLVFDPGGAVQAVAGRTVRGLADRRAVDHRFEPEPTVRPPLRRGDVVGRVTVAAPRRPLGTVPAVVAEAVPGTEPLDALEVLGGILRIAHLVLAPMGLPE